MTDMSRYCCASTYHHKNYIESSFEFCDQAIDAIRAFVLETAFDEYVDEDFEKSWTDCIHVSDVHKVSGATHENANAGNKNARLVLDARRLAVEHFARADEYNARLDDMYENADDEDYDPSALFREYYDAAEIVASKIDELANQLEEDDKE